MYMIPYFLEIETKKLLKIKLSKVINNITDDFINILFTDNSDNKYQNIITKLDKKIKEAALGIIKDTINIVDNLFLNSDDRKRYFNVCNKYSRSIFTVFGYLEFERTYYRDKYDKTKHFYFIDTLFNFPMYDHYDYLIKAISIDNAINTNQKKGAELTNNMLNSISDRTSNKSTCNISRQDIYNWINKWNIPKVEYDPINTDSDTLYIMIDEKYIHEQVKKIISKEETKVEAKSTLDIANDIINSIKNLNNPNKVLLLPAPKEKSKHYLMSKAFISFTGIDYRNKRKSLKNKITFLTTSSNPWQEFMDSISKIFDFEKIKNIKVLSDAGVWIVNGISNLKLYSTNEITHCLCEFHVRQKINRITTDKNQRRLLNNYINEGKKKDFIELIEEIKNGKSEKRRATIDGYKAYLIKYWKAFRNMLDSTVRSSMESHISHNVAKPFSYEPKAFSKNRIQKLIKLQEYKANGINIINLYLKTYRNKEITNIKKEELNFNIFEKNSSNLPVLYANDTLTRLALRGLAC